jgi:hypothetical protein
VLPGNDAHGVWSPDGKHIVFSSARLGFKDESPLCDPPEFQPYGELYIYECRPYQSKTIDGQQRRRRHACLVAFAKRKVTGLIELRTGASHPEDIKECGSLPGRR